MDISEKLKDILDEFNTKFGYELTEKEDEGGYLVFERKVECGRNTHRLIIEDHRWELALPTYDPQKDIGDWLIFSMLTDDERDWFGRYMETQYPLTYNEYKLIDCIIRQLETEWDD